ncbi:MAG: WcaF family extracellular polysaccharide biosynthesis acetyltransferase [Planctomycetota bacterium]
MTSTHTIPQSQGSESHAGQGVAADQSSPPGIALQEDAQHKPLRPRPHVSVVILTLNEEINIRAAIDSCDWCDDVHVLDSGSTDRTQEIARELDVAVHYNAFTSFGEQRNWAIDNIPTKHPWIFHLDADERFTDSLVDAMADLLNSDPEEAGFHIPSKTMFMGRWLKRSAGYPTYQMRLFHKERMRFIDYGHGQREEEYTKIGVLDVPYLHYSFSKGIYDWLDKHNRYSTLEALQVIQGKEYDWKFADLFFGKKIHRWRAWKELIYHLPMRSKLRWFGILFINGGILEGKPARTYANLMAIYENMISTKLRVLRNQIEMGADSIPPTLREPSRHFGPKEVQLIREPWMQKMPAGDTHEDRHVPHQPDAPPTSRDTGESMQEYNLDHLPQMQPESSPWSFKGKVARAIWMTIGSKLFRFSFHNWYRYRRILLRLFGAKIGKNVVIRPSAHIEIPWTLHIDDNASIGDKAIIYSLGMIHIGKRAIISQYAHLCAGTHDYTDHTFKLLRTPITIGDDCWVGTDAFIGPGVTIGTLSVVGARSSVYKNVPPGKVAVGNPAKIIKDRELK